MLNSMRSTLFVLLLVAITSTEMFGQKVLSSGFQAYTFRAEWESFSTNATANPGNKALQTPWFKGASRDVKIANLPCHEVWVPVAKGETLQLDAVNPSTPERISSPAFKASSRHLSNEDWYPAQNAVLGEIVIREGQHFQVVRIFPIRFRPGSNEVERSQEVTLSLQKRPSTARTTGTEKTYANHSVLAEGNWFQIGVVQEGIYRLSYEDLEAAGINPNGIDPRSLKVFGNGGKMLPQEAGLFPYDDLAENAIWVSGQGDGTFNQGDFILFYGSSPHEWEYNQTLQRWVHQFNVYSDTTYYYLTYGQGAGKRIPTATDPGSISQTPTYSDQFTFYERELYNPLGSGRYWLGESFDLTTQRDISLSLPGLRSGSEAKVTVRTAARSQVGSNFAFKEGSSNLGSIGMGPAAYIGYGNFYVPAHQTFVLNASQLGDQKLDLNITYSKPQTSSIGYLDYIEAVYQQELSMSGKSFWKFYAREGAGTGSTFQYDFGGANASTRVWDVTDATSVREMDAAYTNSRLRFQIAADSIKEMVAFDNQGFRTPSSIKAIGNQDLHNLSPADYVMVAPAIFRSAAEKLARFHREENGFTVHVVTPQQVFHEFSSGQADPTAIRDFMKMFYDRWEDGGGLQPRYLLLFGEGSYDRKEIAFSEVSDLVPSYQSRNSHHALGAYTSDDYFAFMDDGEGFWGESLAQTGGFGDILYYIAGDTLRNNPISDIGVGRLPMKTAQEAEDMVNKIIHYQTAPESRGDWRNKVLLIADHLDEEGILHISQSDGYTDEITSANPCINIEKVFMDNYQMVPTASANTFPAGREALLRGLENGALLANYTGHGGENAWSNSSILTTTDINQLENYDRLPAFVTATCEFGRWDDPGRRSGAEQLLLNTKGGGIALFTTVRVVDAYSNEILNENFYEEVFRWQTDENRWPTMGEVFQATKNASTLGGALNNRKFSLLGDPGLTLVYPKKQVKVTSINGQAVQTGQIDSLSSLSLVTVQGEVQDSQDNLIDGFSGELSVTVFDKPSQFQTRRSPYNFTWQKNRIFKGKATVRDGKFSFQFVVPLDVSYDDGSAKISLYVESAQTDGAGCYSEIYAGGTDANSLVDDSPPELELFMNDEKFVDGGMVGPEPVLLVETFDETGLNTTGNGIGHELTAVIDQNLNDPIVLNEFYESAQDDYRNGTIRYPFSELPTGTHDIDVKIWDVANNSASGKISFVVTDDANAALGHVLNYPNPFTTSTKFIIEHNLNDRPLRLQIKIFTISGRLVKTLEDAFYATGNLYCDMEWDGLDDYGDQLGRGVYIYQVSLKDESTGQKINRFERMVVLR